MNDNLTLIKRLLFIPLNKITAMIPTGLTSVKVNYSESFEIPFVKGSANFDVAHRQSESGDLYATAISCTLKTKLTFGGAGILIMERCDRDTLVLGTMFLPIAIEGSENNDGRSLTISYSFPQFPNTLSA